MYAINSGVQFHLLLRTYPHIKYTYSTNQNICTYILAKSKHYDCRGLSGGSPVCAQYASHPHQTAVTMVTIPRSKCPFSMSNSTFCPMPASLDSHLL